MTFARGTLVGVDRSKAQLDSMLQKAGASKRSIGVDDDRGVARVQFELQSVLVMMTIPLPKLEEFRHKPNSTWRERPKEQQRKLHEQACRERWRQLILIVKAKLEAIAVPGLTTVEREFLADVQTSTGKTIHEVLKELTGEMPIGNAPLMLGMGPR